MGAGNLDVNVPATVPFGLGKLDRLDILDLGCVGCFSPDAIEDVFGGGGSIDPLSFIGIRLGPSVDTAGLLVAAPTGLSATAILRGPSPEMVPGTAFAGFADSCRDDKGSILRGLVSGSTISALFLIVCVDVPIPPIDTAFGLCTLGRFTMRKA